MTSVENRIAALNPVPDPAGPADPRVWAVVERRLSAAPATGPRHHPGRSAGRRSVAIALVVALSAGGASAVAATVAHQTADEPSGREVAGSERATATADVVTRWVAAHPSRDGWGDSVVDAETGGLTVYWNGAVPDELRHQVRGRDVRFRSCRYTNRQLAEGVRQLMDHSRPRADGVSVVTPTGLVVTAVGPDEAADGLAVSYSAESADGPDSAVRRQLSELAGVAVVDLDVLEPGDVGLF